MITHNNKNIVAAIFDVDSTLLDNADNPDPRFALHERSRLAAVHAVGQARELPALAALTPDENLSAFLEAKTHTLNGAVWNILYRAGLVVTEELEPSNPLLQEIVDLKNELHKDILLEHGQEVPGARLFLGALANAGLKDRMAVASTAIRRDLNIFFEKFDMEMFFPPERIISIEKVTRPKPHPEAFDLAFATLNLPAEDKARTLAFEDDPRGIMAAQAAGMIVCGITTRYSREHLSSLAVPPDVIADSFAEFQQIFKLDA